MNRCDDAGNCDQGRNCPARKQMADDQMMQLEKKYDYWMANNGLCLLIVLGPIALLAAVIVGWFVL